MDQAFEMALTTRKPLAGLLHHSDPGIQSAGEVYQTQLVLDEMQVSMNQTGNCWDNSPMESFFSTLKVELIYFQDYANRKEARTDIFYYIEGFYNSARRHPSLGYLSPVEFERQYYQHLSSLIVHLFR